MDAWAAFEAARQGCSGGLVGPVAFSNGILAPMGIAAVGDCAVLLAYGDGTLWIATASTWSRFTSVTLSSDLGVVPLVAAAPDGIWIADGKMTGSLTLPTLTLARPDQSVAITLPADSVSVRAIQPISTGLLVALDTADIDYVAGGFSDFGAALLSVTRDGSITMLWSAAGSSITSLVVDGATMVMVVARTTGSDVSVVANRGHGWSQIAFPMDGLSVTSVAAHGDTLVALAQRLTPHDVADTVVTSISRDFGRTWTSHETSSNALDPPNLLGFHGDAVLAATSLNAAAQGLVQLTDAAEWVPADPIPTPPGAGNVFGGSTILTACGLWILDTPPDAGNTVLTHLPLAGVGC